MAIRVFVYSAFYIANRFTMCTKFPTAHNTKQLYLGMKYTVTDSLVLHLFSNFSRKTHQQCALLRMYIKHTHRHTCLTALFPGPRVSRYQKCKNNLDFTQARDSAISWDICKSAPHSRQITTPPLSFLQAGCPSCRPTNSVKALKANVH